jgi:hypothetical protein
MNWATYFHSQRVNLKSGNSNVSFIYSTSYNTACDTTLYRSSLAFLCIWTLTHPLMVIWNNSFFCFVNNGSYNITSAFKFYIIKYSAKGKPIYCKKSCNLNSGQHEIILRLWSIEKIALVIIKFYFIIISFPFHLFIGMSSVCYM